jgi:hypothetical protein
MMVQIAIEALATKIAMPGSSPMSSTPISNECDSRTSSAAPEEAAAAGARRVDGARQ